MAIRKLILTAILAATVASSENTPASEGAKARIAKETRHEILSLPYFDVLDNIEFRVDSYNVTLIGQVTRPTLKSDAQSAVRGIDGVETSRCMLFAASIRKWPSHEQRAREM